MTTAPSSFDIRHSKFYRHLIFVIRHSLVIRPFTPLAWSALAARRAVPTRAGRLQRRAGTERSSTRARGGDRRPSSPAAAPQRHWPAARAPPLTLRWHSFAGPRLSCDRQGFVRQSRNANGRRGRDGGGPRAVYSDPRPRRHGGRPRPGPRFRRGSRRPCRNSTGRSSWPC